ncbi:MAG: ABC-F type ribosomal protection protein [Clostridia bacterium]|nr:ABC-F type ribosomal protection protein [Clostridia bacterium]
MISLSVSGLSYSIGVKEILTNITFSVEEGDRLGIVGVNGSGKTTLLSLIVGDVSPDSGEIYIAKDKCVGILRQNEAFDETTDAGETVLSHMYGTFPQLLRDEKRLAEIEAELKSNEADVNRLTAEYDRVNRRYIDGGGLHYKSRCKSILTRLGFQEDMHLQKVSSLSGGQKTRLSLARLIFREPDILILDEPTNHLDTQTMMWLEDILSGYKKTLLAVSHDRYFLDKVTNKTLDVEHHRANLYKCSYTEYVKQKNARRAADEKKYNLQQKEIARLEAFIEQQRRWNREKNIVAAESREKAIARMEKVDRPKDAPKAIRFSFDEGMESGNDVLSVKNLSMGFGKKTVFSDLSFEVKKREHLFIAGPNGCGKSTLLKVLLEKYSPTEGKFTFGYNVSIGYYDQENQNLDDDKTVLDELWDAYPNVTQTQLRNTLAAFMFRGDDIEKKVRVLSGGERARLTLAKLILSKMNLLILDEPTNHLDIPSREALEDALLSYDGTIIAVSHDRYFMKKLATRVLDLSGPVRDWKGGYEEYAAHLSAPCDETEKKEKVSSGKEQYLHKKAEDAKKRKEQNRRKRVLEEIAKIENELEEINLELFGEAATDYVRAAELEEKRNSAEERLFSLYEEEEAFEKEE